MLDTKARSLIDRPIETMAKILEKFSLKPNHITIIAFLVGLLASCFIAIDKIWLSIMLLWLSGLFDVLDGQVARLTNMSSKSGALLDMILDRMVEGFFVLGIVIANPNMNIPVILFLIIVIFNFSTFLAAGALIPNTGKKSIHYDVGLIERTETFIFFTLAALLPEYRIIIFMVLNSLILFTGTRRFIIIFKQINRLERNSK